MLILTTLPILFRQRPSENTNSFSYNQSTNLPLAPLTFSSFISGWAVSSMSTSLLCLCVYLLHFTSPVAAEMSRITALSLLCQPQHTNCSTAIIHTVPSIFDTPTHSFSSSYSSTFPVPLKDLPPLLIMGVGRERQQKTTEHMWKAESSLQEGVLSLHWGAQDCKASNSTYGVVPLYVSL